MATKANKEIIEWEIGVKNRRPYKVLADQMVNPDYTGQLTFKLRGQITMIVANQKWDYVRRVTPFPTDNGPFTQEDVERIQKENEEKRNASTNK